NGMMLDLARGFGKALDMADKAGIDGATLTRAVQDPTVFEELAARTPKAAEAILAVRDEFAKARNMYEAVTKVALPDNPLYMPRRMTSDAWDLINSKPEFKAEMSGPAAFTQARTLRSGQDNAAREVEKQSTVFLGAEVPRNLSDAQVTDWANARYKQIFGDQAPQLFETDPRKLIDSYLSEFKRQMQQDMFTVRWLDAGFGSEQAQKAWNIVGGGKERVTAVADQFMGKVSDMSQQMDSLMADLNRGLGDLKFAKGFEGGAKAFDETVRSTRQLEEALAKGDWQFVREQAQREADRAFLRARRAEGKLAETWQRFGERMSSLRDAAEANIRNVATNRQSALDRLDSKVADIGVARRDAQRAGNDALASLTEARDAAYGRSVQAWDQPRGVANEAAIAAASDAARRKAERDWMPTLADRKALEKLRRTRGSNLTQATLEDIVYGDARRVAGDNAAAKVEAKLRERAVAAEKQRIYKSEFGYAQAEKRLADAEAKGVAQDAAFQQRIADTLATRPQIEDQFARRAANAQAAFNRLPQSQQEEWFRFLNGNKQAASLYKTMQDNYMIGGLLSGEARSGAGIGPYIENLKQDLQRMTVSLTDSSGRVVNSTSSEMRKAARETIDQLDKIASAAKNTLADELYAQAGVVEAEGNFFLSYAFNKTATKELPNDARIARSGDKVLRNRATTEARREVAKAQAGVRKLLQMDAEEQILPMLQNVIARSALSEGFKSLPAEAQALFKQAEENLLKKGNLKNALHLYDKLNNVLKGWLIAKPGFVFRNLIGGLFMNMVAGVSVDSHFRMLRAFEADILRQQGKPGKWERLNKFDRAIYEQVRKFQTQGDTLVGSMTADSPSKSILSWFNPASANFFWLKGNRKFNEVAEDIVLRGSMAFDTLSRDPALIAAFKNGDQAGIDRALQAARSRAIGRVDMFHFSYDKADKSVFENEVMGRLVPFYTYTKNVIPLMTSMMIERPKYFAWANSVARNLQLGVPEDAVLPEYIKESGAIRTPFTAGGNRVYWMQDLPFNQLIDVNNDHVNFAASAFTPLVKTPVELVHGQQFYKKIPLTSDMKPSQYQNVPGLSQALSALGVQRTGNDGQTQFMQDRWQYLLGQLVPPAYQLGNYTAATDTQKLKLPTRATSDLTGIRLRVNTPEDQANEMARQKIKEREKKSQKTRNAKRGYGDFPAGYKPKKNENQK
ncbi:hypothetical protein EBQ81_02700, partial [bacterium]|nr:hypothetical protein [bacterium]